MALASVAITAKEVYADAASDPEEILLTVGDWGIPVQLFLGRNGSGKSRAGKAISDRLSGKYLSTDRLQGIVSVNSWGWGSAPTRDSKGLPIGDISVDRVSRQHGIAAGDLMALREQPDVLLRVAAFIRRALGREVELRETAGFLDPWVSLTDGVSYSLLRDEGHGLRELVVLLSAVYQGDWKLIVIDEPELHLHPSMSRLWMSELRRECLSTGRNAIVITHSPALVSPDTVADLDGYWYFRQGAKPVTIGSCIIEPQADRVTEHLRRNRSLIPDLVFSPRPVLVEGPTDQAAFNEALGRLAPHETVSQTDFVECGGSSGVALWFEIATKMGVPFRAIADLDALFAPEIARAMDSTPAVVEAYRAALGAEPAITKTALKPILEAMGTEGIAKDPRSRALWVLTKMPESSGHASRHSMLLRIWREAGLWLHPEGTLEDVLGIDSKGMEEARAAASVAGPIDHSVGWAAYVLDSAGDVELLLNVAVERIAHRLMEAMRSNPDAAFTRPVGATAEIDGLLVDVVDLGERRIRLIVKLPRDFAGYSLEFSRDTPSSALKLDPPTNPAVGPSVAEQA